MLKIITKKFVNKSTDKFFKFSFYCDRCNKEWTSEEIEFIHGFGEKLTEGESKAKEIMWRTDYERALERSNLEARLRFARCKVCKRFICDECFHLEGDDNLCIDCANLRTNTNKTGKGKNEKNDFFINHDAFYFYFCIM